MNEIENNKLIAEFMGFEVGPFENKGGAAFEVKLKGVPNKLHGFSCAKYGTLQYNIDTVCAFSSINYHTSWDWLMPVVGKIESLELHNEITFHIQEKEAYILFHNTNPPLVMQHISLTKIDAVYKTVIAFIKWYNTTKN